MQFMFLWHFIFCLTGTQFISISWNQYLCCPSFIFIFTVHLATSCLFLSHQFVLWSVVCMCCYVVLLYHLLSSRIEWEGCKTGLIAFPTIQARISHLPMVSYTNFTSPWAVITTRPCFLPSRSTLSYRTHCAFLSPPDCLYSCNTLTIRTCPSYNPILRWFSNLGYIDFVEQNTQKWSHCASYSAVSVPYIWAYIH